MYDPQGIANTISERYCRAFNIYMVEVIQRAGCASTIPRFVVRVHIGAPHNPSEISGTSNLAMGDAIEDLYLALDARMM